MTINPNDPKWTAYVLGELDDQDRAEIERLMATSEEARTLVEELRFATTILKDQLTGDVPLLLTPGQRTTIREAAAPQVRRRWFGAQTAAWATGLAAAGLILVAVTMPSLVRSPESLQLAAPSDP